MSGQPTARTNGRHTERKAVDQLGLDLGDGVGFLLRRFYPLLFGAAYADVGATLALDLAFDLENERVQDTLDGLALLVRRVAESTREEIRGIIGQAAEEGLGPAQIAERIRQAGVTQSVARSEAIARSESARAYSAGSLLAYEDAGIEQVEWLIGPEPCELCKPLDGKIIALGEEFADGVRHPPLHPNCTCSLAPVV